MDAIASSAPPSFEGLMLPHLDAAHNLACWLLHDPHDAADAVQDAYLRAFRAFDRFRGADGRAWLLTIVRNVCYSRLRQQRREPEKVLFEEEAHAGVDEAGSAQAIAWREASAAALQQALAGLAPEYREVIVLHEIEGMAYREIAAVVDVPIGTVMSRLSRARARLQAGVRAVAEKEAR